MTEIQLQEGSLVPELEVVKRAMEKCYTGAQNSGDKEKFEYKLKSNKVQFIMTTHSPSVLANVKHEHILLLEDGEVLTPNNTTYGRDISDILREMMKVKVRPREVLQLKADFYKLLAEEKYELAKEQLKQLENILGENDADVVSARVAYDLEVL